MNGYSDTINVIDVKIMLYMCDHLEYKCEQQKKITNNVYSISL